MCEFASESGAQLVARIQSRFRPPLSKLLPEIITNHGPFPSEIIEISGKSNVGKSMLLLELIAKTIIPIEHGGKGAFVILIDLASNFQMFSLFGVLEKHILHHKMITSASTDTEDLQQATNNVQEIIHIALTNLIIFNCYTGNDFDRVMYQVDELLATNNGISLIAIESLGNFYWNDTPERTRMDYHLRGSLEIIKKLLDKYQVTLAYTKPAYFVSRGDKKMADMIRYKIELISRDSSFSSFDAITLCDGKSLSRNYCIKNLGIEWIYSRN